MTARSEIAAAASTVAGVKVDPYYRQTTKVGDGWIDDAVINPDDAGFGWLTTWKVRIVTPQDNKSSQKYLESKGAALVAALARHLTVIQIERELGVFEAGGPAVPVITITGVRGDATI